jgi:hypothetical protein
VVPRWQQAIDFPKIGPVEALLINASQQLLTLYYVSKDTYHCPA